ncbi:glycoside hydrolase family 25 protein [Rhizobium tumorigenes]|uniref:glycoside hydrolase family 25 protein n=1 Tax=Rhizobium tumorigenes TaxID=2041385 RepID=UPI00241C7CAA|nr:GH25 family lysozyme [Rhizobium tumorigenes]WFS01450.1 GH25 family lysozyme [Rhizobium tumorigenes]
MGKRTLLTLIVGSLLILALPAQNRLALAGERQPWNDPEHALIIDAYELNSIDWDALLQDTRISGFVSKASDGLPEDYACKTSDHSGDTVGHCKTMWRKYAVSRELFRTRRLIAKSNGILWGAYHLGRPGNPIDQANHFLDYADPKADELMVLDIDGLDPQQFMSLADAQIFSIHIKERTGRYPILYANDVVARFIADHRNDYQILSRLPLWYARYKPDVEGTFPLGNWTGYAMWQFSSADNCSSRRCPYRVAGTLPDIDVNMASMTKTQLARIWPQGELVPPRIDTPSMLASAPGPAAKMQVTALNYQDF